MPLKKKNIYGITFYTEFLTRKVDLGDFIFISENIQIKIQNFCVESIFFCNRKQDI